MTDKENDDLIKKLAADDANESNAEDDFVSKQSKGNKSRLLMPLSILAGAGVVTAGFFLVSPFVFNTIDSKEVKGTIVSPNEEPVIQEGVLEKTIESFVYSEGNEYPVKRSSELLKDSSIYSDDELKENLLKEYKNSDFVNTTGILPSEEAGFVNDTSKSTDEYGFPNPLYSYWTDESFKIELAHIIETLINPKYGNWEELQFLKEKGLPDIDNLENITTEKFFKSFIENPKEGPLYGDFSMNNYGENDLLDSGTRWIGKVKSTDVDFDFSGEKVKAKVFVSLDYNAWTTNKEKKTKSATLELDLVQSGKTGIYERILIDNAKLIIKGDN